MRVLEFRPVVKNTLRGFFTLELFNKIQIKDCTLHEKDGRPWIGFPGIPWTDKDGKTAYKNVIFIPDKQVLEAMQKEACGLLSEHLHGHLE